MGIFYNMSHPTNEVVAKLTVFGVPGLRPVDNKDERTKEFWPYGVTDGVHTGWFEDAGGQGIIHFWGTNNPTTILQRLRTAGIRCTYGG